MSNVENPQGKEMILAGERMWVEAQWAGDMQEAIERVRELHKAIEVGTQYGDNFGDLGCPVCNELYPCPTIKALDGEQ